MLWSSGGYLRSLEVRERTVGAAVPMGQGWELEPADVAIAMNMTSCSTLLVSGGNKSFQRIFVIYFGAHII